MLGSVGGGQQLLAQLSRSLLEVDQYAIGEDGRESFDAQIPHPQVREMMQRLHVDERSVLALVSIEGQYYQRAAETLGIPIRTVMSPLSRARNELALLLDGGAAPSNHD